MSVLSDRQLRLLYPAAQHVGPASVDLTIGDSLQVWPERVTRDPRTDQSDIWEAIDPESYAGNPIWILQPGNRYLTTTRERIEIPDDCAGQIGARSSWGRDGLAVVCGPAGWIDPGYRGRPTLELSVVGSDLVIWPGARVAQLIVFRLETPCLQPYRGKYQEDDQPTASRLWQERPS